MYRYIFFMAAMMLPIFIYFYFFIKRILGLFLKEDQKRRKRFTALGLTIANAVFAWNIFSFWAMVLLHILGFAVLLDIIRIILVKGLHKENARWHKIYCSGILPVLGTAMVLCYGYLNMQQVMRTEYTVVTEKKIREEGYELVFLSDLHYGTTMGKEKLEEYCERMGREQPDLVILGGDIVDEHNTLEEVQEVFQILSKIDSTYGIYYVYGNHDKARYSGDSGFTEEQLAGIMEYNNIQVLADKTCQLNPDLSISGRRDRSEMGLDGNGREPSHHLLDSNSSESYRILADHQPRSFGENEEAGFDLMLSGHTHAGQMWPVGLITTFFGRDTYNYGYKKAGKMDIIVSSGIAGWGYPVRTGKHCEYVLVHIR